MLNRIWNCNDAGNREMENCVKNKGIRRHSSCAFSISFELMCATKFSVNWVSGVITGIVVHISSKTSLAQMQLFVLIFMDGKTFPWTASWFTL